MQLDRHFLSRVSHNFTVLTDIVMSDPQFSVDTRTLQRGNIFVALAGNQVDGHDFIAQAFSKGAAGCIISENKRDILKKIDPKNLEKKYIVLAQDTREALFAIAKEWRKQFEYPVIAITGSVGKTSTKELLSHVLKVYQVSHVVSSSNYNTAIGAALTIISMRDHHKVLVQEVGIAKRGEMAKIIDILKPTTSLITCIGHQHMDGLGSLQDIAMEKREVFSQFTEKNIGIINGDDPLLSNVSYNHPVIRFGFKTINQIQARKVRVSDGSISCTLKIYKNKYDILLPQSHEGIVMHVLAVAAVAHLLQIPENVIVKAVQQKVVVSSRFEIKSLAVGTGLLIDDAYNANPESMKAALLALENIDAQGPKIAVIGDMLGLGVNSPFWHRQIGRFLRKVPSLTKVILVGDFVKWTKKTVPLNLATHIVPNWQEATSFIEKELSSSPVILVKGSYGMGLHNLVQKFSLPIKQAQ